PSCEWHPGSKDLNIKAILSPVGASHRGSHIITFIDNACTPGLAPWPVLDELTAGQNLSAHFPTTDGWALIFDRHTPCSGDFHIPITVFIPFFLWVEKDEYLAGNSSNLGRRLLILTLAQPCD